MSYFDAIFPERMLYKTTIHSIIFNCIAVWDNYIMTQYVGVINATKYGVVCNGSNQINFWMKLKEPQGIPKCIEHIFPNI